VFLYVNSVFAPGLDEGVGGLFRVCVLFFVFVLGFVLSLWFWFWFWYWFGLNFVLDERDGRDIFVNVQC
jgi:hypothetical protein